MKIHEDVAILNEILESWRDELDEDFLAYRNHCYRVLNYCLVFSDYHEDSLNKVSIAVAHHDLGIWVDQTFDYLKEPLINLVKFCELTRHQVLGVFFENGRSLREK